MLFTDVAGSTELLARIGDAEYRALRATHERHVRLEVEQSGGRLISVTGDGTFSLFDGPTHAVRCADEIRKGADELGISVRAGVHTGELERTGRDFTGLSVHIGARVGAMAMPNEILVSRAVRDLVAGSGLAFVEHGEHTLRGVPGSWDLYALAAADQPAILPTERSLQTPLDRLALRTARTAPRAMRAASRVGNALQRYRTRAGTNGV
jgi:class 3 adenylate cyclase